MHVVNEELKCGSTLPLSSLTVATCLVTLVLSCGRRSTISRSLLLLLRPVQRCTTAQNLRPCGMCRPDHRILEWVLTRTFTATDHRRLNTWTDLQDGASSNSIIIVIITSSSSNQWHNSSSMYHNHRRQWMFRDREECGVLDPAGEEDLRCIRDRPSQQGERLYLDPRSPWRSGGVTNATSRTPHVPDCTSTRRRTQDNINTLASCARRALCRRTSTRLI